MNLLVAVACAKTAGFTLHLGEIHQVFRQQSSTWQGRKSQKIESIYLKQQHNLFNLKIIRLIDS
jgi:hypothetical protein